MLLVVGALFFTDSVATLFRLFRTSVLGVILFFGGIELAASMNGDALSRPDRTVLVVTAGVALWNMGRLPCGTTPLPRLSARYRPPLKLPSRFCESGSVDLMKRQ